MSVYRDQFLQRLGADAPKGLQDDITAAFGLVDRLKERAAAVRNNKNLSEHGRVTEMQKMIGGDFAGHLNQLKSNVQRARDHIASQRAGLAPKAPDRTDMFGEMQRREMRDHLKTLPMGERLRLAMADETVRDAILFAPPSIEILPPQHREGLIRESMEKEHGVDLAILAKLEEQVANVNAAIQVAEMDMKRVTELHDHQFAVAVAPQQAAA